MLGCGIVSARIPGIATHYAFKSKPGALNDAMPCHSIACVMRTTGNKSAGWGAERTDQVLVTMYQLDHDCAHLLSTRLNSFSKSPLGAPCSPTRLTITTRSRLNALMLCCLNTSRITRFARLRSFACGSIRLLAMMPRRALLLLL